MKKKVFLNSAGLVACFFLIISLLFSASTVSAADTPTLANGLNIEKRAPITVTPTRETYPIMRPDTETRRRWIKEYERAPKAMIDRELMETMAPQGAMSLLSRLQYTPAERDQGVCGNCWAWAGTGVMGIDLDVNQSVHERLSIQYLNSCTIGDYPCCGGWLYDLANFYTANKQALAWANTNADWADGTTTCATGSSSQACATITKTPGYGITSIDEVTIPTHGVTEATATAYIKNILTQNKGVWFGFFLPNDTAWNDFFSFWNTQAESVLWDFDPYNNVVYEGAGHAVLCVGYNDDDPNPDKHYWIMLNSWGAPANRPNGLFRVKMHMNYENNDTVFYNLYFQTLNMRWGAVSGGHDFYWPMFMPAISGRGCRIGPLWGAYTTVCCSSSSLTFSITVSGKTKRSTAASCAVAPTWDGWEETTAGAKSVFWQVTSPTCGTYSGTFPWVMKKGKFYGFQLELVNGRLKIMVYIGDACTVTQNTQVIESQSLIDGTIGKEKVLFKQVKEIGLDIPPDAFKANSIPVNSFQTVR